jgi:hypothetical protein
MATEKVDLNSSIAMGGGGADSSPLSTIHRDKVHVTCR